MSDRPVPLAITAYTVTCAAGRGREAFARALAERKSGLRENDLAQWPLPCWIGRVAGIEDAPLPPAWAAWESRNHRLAWLGLNQDGFRERALAAIERYGAARVALILGTSTSSIGETERAYRELDADGRFDATQRRSRVHNSHALAAFVQRTLGARGPCLTISTACSSSAKVFASARR
ncbi:MAG: beta-ketoacyl-[acyl-carrier-protein] synthase II, partial [Xanthomonadaceae bacterium]|nr:beta-ketoacyl-[acyl-carrier-protein] synthase II [Xanthomonadaceae bacterium]